MSKKLRREAIYIAPEIIGFLDENYVPIVTDERTGKSINVYDDFDKIEIYERQVKEWFLDAAVELVKKENRGFIVLMICLSYLEGAEQFYRGESSHGKSRKFFVSALNRLYPSKFDKHDLERFYVDARCGLFHTGMVQGKIVINYDFVESLSFPNPTEINVNPKLLLIDIKKDFKSFIERLRADKKSCEKFSRLYSNI